MKTKSATTIFEALSSESRLEVFRLLVKHAPDGLVAGEIARQLKIPSTNLSFHLKSLLYSQLVNMEKEGRFWRYRANIPLMLDTIAYLTAECCSGKPEQCRVYWEKSGIAPEFIPACCEDKKS
jgi:DNA-binding transcriptional ArsR family regulator